MVEVLTVPTPTVMTGTSKTPTFRLTTGVAERLSVYPEAEDDSVTVSALVFLAGVRIEEHRKVTRNATENIAVAVENKCQRELERERPTRRARLVSFLVLLYPPPC